MSLLTKMEEDLKTAMKAREELRLSTLRLLKSDIQYELNKSGAKDMDDNSVQEIIKRSVKKRKDSIEQYLKAGRMDSAAREESEMAILKEYLPEEISAEEINQLLDELLKGGTTPAPSDMGKLMGGVMARFKGKNIDGSLVKEQVQKRLKS